MTLEQMLLGFNTNPGVDAGLWGVEDVTKLSEKELRELKERLHGYIALFNKNIGLVDEALEAFRQD